MIYAHFQDLADGYVGPFATEAEIQVHVEFCKQRGDGAKFMGIVNAVPEGEMLMTAEEDREWVDLCYGPL